MKFAHSPENNTAAKAFTTREGGKEKAIEPGNMMPLEVQAQISTTDTKLSDYLMDYDPITRAWEINYFSQHTNASQPPEAFSY